MRVVRGAAIILLMCVTVALGCRRQEPIAKPDDATIVETSSTSDELSGRQKAAIEAITAAGGEVELDAGGQLVSIDLANERTFADETLVRALLQFPELKSLRLAVTSVPDVTLAELAKLTQLEELFLQDAALDDAGLTVLLAAMPNLRRLTLRRLSGVTDGALSAVADCHNLEVVALIEMNELTGVGVEELAKVPRLRSLDLRSCGRLTAGDFRRLTALQDLVEVKLGGPAVNDEIADVILGLLKVRSLVIEDAEISSAFFEKLASDERIAERLQSLAFARCFGVTDETLLSIGKFPNLESLSLRDIMVSGEFLASLSKAGTSPLPLKTLIATNAFLDDTVVEILPTLAPNLERLDLRGNMGITDQSRATFERLKYLKDLKLE